MKNIISILIVGILILSGFGASALVDNNFNTSEISKSIYFSEPQLIEKDNSFEISLKESTSNLLGSGEYKIPAVTNVFTIPFASKVKSVNVVFSDEKTIEISKKLILAPQILPDIYSRNTEILLSKEPESLSFPQGLFPEERFSYNVGAGRSGDNMVNYLTVKLFPIQYDSSKDVIYYSDSAEITIDYIPPENLITVADEYDLLIITPSEFASNLEPLVTHKNNHDMKTIMLTLPEIYESDYFPVQGRDDAEKIKYFIKSSFDEWGIKYVLLVGGRNGGINEEKWWCPTRYSNMDDGGEETFLCDLYFSDIYDSEGNFSSWDSDGDLEFSEWTFTSRDIPEMYPDVYVGRLACRTNLEVKTMVNKIITYENEAYTSDWFYRFVGVAGDTYPNHDDPYYEGELATQASAEYLDGFESSFIWGSTGTFTEAQDVIDEVSKGCGFLHFSGHGNPYIWSNHPPQNESVWIDGPTAFDMYKFSNKDQLPVTIVGGCHNGQFNVGLANMISGILEYGIAKYFFKSPFVFYRMDWIPRCWSWSFVNKAGGGGIAIISNTGYGYGIPGEDWATGNGRFMEMQFFKSFSEGYTILGETHGMDLVSYLNEFPPIDDKIDCKIVQQWCLLGDPSLQIGGYS